MKDKKNMPTWFPGLVNKLEKEGNKKTVYTSKKDPSLSMEVNDKGDIKVEHKKKNLSYTLYKNYLEPVSDVQSLILWAL